MQSAAMDQLVRRRLPPTKSLREPVPRQPPDDYSNAVILEELRAWMDVLRAPNKEARK
jgi:hypothetical protein